MTYTYNYLQFQNLGQKFLISTLTNQCISIDVFTIITLFSLLCLYVVINSKSHKYAKRLHVHAIALML